jgi:hypothetical protein
LIQRVLILGKHFGNGLLVWIHDCDPLGVFTRNLVEPRPFV